MCGDFYRVVILLRRQLSPKLVSDQAHNFITDLHELC